MNRRNRGFMHEQPEMATPAASTSSQRRRLFVIAAIVLLLGFAAILLRRATVDLPDHPDAYDPVTLEPKESPGLIARLKQFVFSEDVALAGTRDDRINILLLGMGGPGHDGPYLTDTIILASIQPSTNDVAMISIPRDLGVDIPGHGQYKINHANAFGEAKSQGNGAVFATQVIEQTFDMTIDYHVRVDFAAFEQVIDDVGGVDVNIERSFTDSQYPAANNEYQTIRFTAGVEHMNGDRALKYARSRHGNNGEGSDFARARRQQQVILALKKKVLSVETLANPFRIHKIMNTLGSHISTNLEFSDMMSLLKRARTIDTTNMETLVLDSSPNGFLTESINPNGAYILSPKGGNFDAITTAIDTVFTSTSTATKYIEVPDQSINTSTPKSSAAIEVQNGTWRAGLAARTSKFLESRQYSVASISNTDERPQTKSGIYVTTDAFVMDTAKALQEVLDVPIKQQDQQAVAASTTEILIILGQDFSDPQSYGNTS